MVLDGGVGTATAVSSAVNISLRLFQFIYEFKAVGQQTQDLLDSTKHVSSTLESARTLRQQKSSLLSTDERKWIDNILIDSKRCLESVAALVEPARVDLQTKSGRVGFLNRSLFVFRDSPKVATNLARLNLAHQSLNAAMGVLCSKGSYWQPATYQQRWQFIPEMQGMGQQELMPPPSYEKDQSLYARKLHRTGSIPDLRSHGSAQAILLSDDYERLCQTTSHSQYTNSIAELDSSDMRLTTILEKDCLVQSPVELDSNVSRVPPVTSFKDFEGLQVVDDYDSKCQRDGQAQSQAQSKLDEHLYGPLPTAQRSEDWEVNTRPIKDEPKYANKANHPECYTKILSDDQIACRPMRARSKGRAWLELRGMQRPS